MLKHLKLTMGPADAQLEFADRLSLITGDNDLGNHVQGGSNA